MFIQFPFKVILQLCNYAQNRIIVELESLNMGLSVYYCRNGGNFKLKEENWLTELLCSNGEEICQMLKDKVFVVCSHFDFIQRRLSV